MTVAPFKDKNSLESLAVFRSNSSSNIKSPIEYFIASDVNAIIEHTKTVVYMEDEDMLHIQGGVLSYFNLKKIETDQRKLHTIEMELDNINKGKFEHFMLKEIHEQEESVLNTMRGRVNFNSGKVTLGGLMNHREDIRFSRRLVLIGCGTSFHSALAVTLFPIYSPFILILRVARYWKN